MGIETTHLVSSGKFILGPLLAAFNLFNGMF